jgi:hypothetical protein
MTQPSPDRGSATQNVLLVLLVAGLAIGVSLLFLMQSSRGGARFEVSEPEPFDCPTGASAPVCIRYEVANTGGGEAFMQCELTPFGDSTASFTDDTSVYLSDRPIPAGATATIYVKVAPGDSDEVREPSVSCTPVD